MDILTFLGLDYRDTELGILYLVVLVIVIHRNDIPMILYSIYGNELMYFPFCRIGGKVWTLLICTNQSRYYKSPQSF